MLHTAIEQGEWITFRYYAPKGETERKIEPYHLLFNWSSWYVWGWCETREDFRLFKLNRMSDLRYTGEKFEKRQAPLPNLSSEKVFPANFQVKARFAPECRWRLIEEYGKDSYREQPDGTLLLSVGFTDKENLFSWLLSFGEKAELLEPPELRQELANIGWEIWQKYYRV